MSQLVINGLVLRIKTKRRPTGEALLHSLLLKPDNLKRVIQQVTEEINPAGNIRASNMVLDLGTLSLAQFETEFNQRLAQALADNLRRLPVDSLPQQASARDTEPAALLAQLGQETASLYPLAILCLQPATLQQLLASQPKERLLLLLKTLLNQSEPLPHYAYQRVTVSRLAIAALGFLLNDSEGRNWLSNNPPSVSQLETWQGAIASGEIAVEQVLDLLLSHRQSPAVASRWLQPLWQRKAVRALIRRQAGTETVREIDARLSQSQRQERDSDNGSQPAVRPTLPVSNAGLVLLWPLLPQLLAHMELCLEGQFLCDAARWQAVQSLHYLAWERNYPAAESFPLSQLLCGIAPDVAMPDIAPLSEQQQQQIDRWLTAIGQQLPCWQALSLADIRQLFLQRPGEIITDTQPPQIAVNPEAFDYLLGDLPWPLTLVSLPWLEQPLTLIWPLPHLTG